MRYLITGGAGFIGSHLTEALLGSGHDVLVLDDFSTGSRANLARAGDSRRLKVCEGSILDCKVVRECVAQAEQVFHLASAVGVQLIMNQPVDSIRTIVEGSANVLAACAESQTPVLLTSTSEVYGKSLRAPFAEDHDSVIGPPTLHRWAYASAKSLDEFLALSYWRQSRLPVVIVRLFNTVGPRQTGQYGMVVPRFAQQALRGEPLLVYGDGTQTRCFCHVSDVVGALVALQGRGDTRGQVFNVGNDVEITIEELAHRVCSQAGSSSRIEHVPYSDAYGPGFEDMVRRVPDLTKIRQYIGYAPRFDLDAILDDVIRHLQAEGAAGQRHS